MRTLIVLCVLAGSASAQDNWYDSDEVRALNRINRSLEDISGELWRNNLWGSNSLGDSYGGGGYYPLPTYRPSQKMIREWNKRYYRYQRAEAYREKQATRRVRWRE